jgi:hypothetical protein
MPHERRYFIHFSGFQALRKRVNLNIRAVGSEQSFLSTDLGQPGNAPAEDGLALMVDRLLEASFSEEEIHTMVVTNTVRLATGKAEHGRAKG